LQSNIKSRISQHKKLEAGKYYIDMQVSKYLMVGISPGILLLHCKAATLKMYKLHDIKQLNTSYTTYIRATKHASCYSADVLAAQHSGTAAEPA
jgi:hypothetical protein